MKYFALSTYTIVLISASLIASLTSSKHSKRSRQGRLISFDSEGGKIKIDLDLSVPFLSIPLDNKNSPDDSPATWLNINVKAIAVTGLVAAVAAFIVPLFLKSTPGQHYRSEDNLSHWEIGNSVNNLLLGNKQVTPCIQRAVCFVIAKVTKPDGHTSNEKIIDGITSHRWFEHAINGTAIQEAVAIGRNGNRHCSAFYQECTLPARLFDNILD